MFIENNFRFTFHKDGFFKTLQGKAAKVLKEVGTGPDWLSSITQDFLFGGFVLCFLLLCYAPTYQNALLAGRFLLHFWHLSSNDTSAAFLGLSNNSAHNWFHLADKYAWRRFYFDCSFVGSREWRVG